MVNVGVAEVAAFLATVLSIIVGVWALAKADRGRHVFRPLIIFLVSEIAAWLLWLVSLWHLGNVFIIVGFCLQINIFLVFTWFAILSFRNKSV